jgi:hypothetical protein
MIIMQQMNNLKKISKRLLRIFKMMEKMRAVLKKKKEKTE